MREHSRSYCMCETVDVEMACTNCLGHGRIPRMASRHIGGVRGLHNRSEPASRISLTYPSDLDLSPIVVNCIGICSEIGRAIHNLEVWQEICRCSSDNSQTKSSTHYLSRGSPSGAPKLFPNRFSGRQPPTLRPNNYHVEDSLHRTLSCTWQERS